MISFIEENVQNDSILKSITPYDYSGYSIMESALDTINFITESFSDIQMSTLLEEYKYLYENGVEIVYEEDETAADGKKTGKLGAVVDKVVTAIKKWGERLFGMIQNAVNHIKAIATSIASKAGISKKTFDSVPEEKFIQYAKAAMKFKQDPNNMNIKSDLIDDWTKEINSDDAHTIVSRYYVNTNNSDNKNNSSVIPPYYSKAAVGAAVFSGYKNIGKKILDARKDITNMLNNKLKEAKEAKSEDMADIMTKYNAAMKHNTAIVSGYLKVYSEYAKECRNIVVRTIGTHKSDEKYNKDLEKIGSKSKKTKDERNEMRTAARTAREEREEKEKAKFAAKSEKNTASFTRAAMSKEEKKAEKTAAKEDKKTKAFVKKNK